MNHGEEGKADGKVKATLSNLEPFSNKKIRRGLEIECSVRVLA